MSGTLDAWTHILPPACFARLRERGSAAGRLKRWLTLPSLHDLDTRFRLMDPLGEYRQVLTPSLPPIEDLAEGAEDGAALARLMNDGLAELVARHPDRFPAWVCTVSLLDPEGAVAELERALAMGAAGLQLTTNVHGEALDAPRFAPVFDRLAEAGRALWLHPARGPEFSDYAAEPLSRHEIWWCFGWPYESSAAMARLVFSGLFDRHPRLRVLTHHMGGMIPFFEGRIAQGWGRQMGARTPDADASLLGPVLRRPVAEYFRLFHGDTALSGSVAATRCGLEYFGAAQVLFASDFPFDAEGGPWMVRAGRGVLDTLALDAATRAAVERGNAARFLQPG